MEAFLKNLIIKADKELNNNGIDLNFSGTSITLILIHNGRLYTSALGNAKSVLYREISEEKKYAIELTNDHIPENREERYRIFEHGGIVQRIVIDGIDKGPLRIWEGIIENGPGLQITRSLGDIKAKKLGVISEPEI